jgi:hypothetical protein
MIVKSETISSLGTGKGFRLFWTRKVHRAVNQVGPKGPQEIRDLIRILSRNNPRWGAPRIHGKLLKLGIQSEREDA